MERVVREVVESPSPEVLKNMWMWNMGGMVRGGPGSAGLVVGLGGFSNLNSSMFP